MIQFFKHEVEQKYEQAFIDHLKRDGKAVVKGIATVTYDKETGKFGFYPEPDLRRKLDS